MSSSPTAAVTKGHFPKRGERKVNGEWKTAAELAAPAPRVRHTMNAADRRNWFRKQAGWPQLRSA